MACEARGFHISLYGCVVHSNFKYLTLKKFHILVFGCQMNYADSARIRAVLANCGWIYVEDINAADVVIFDTCSVRQKSEDKIT